jgi:alpha-glucosidase (family GH31 glycosyl hydrolase)
MTHNLFTLFFMLCCPSTLFAKVEHIDFGNGSLRLSVDALQDDLLKFEFEVSAFKGVSRTRSTPIYSSPMVKPQLYLGPKSFQVSDFNFQTPRLSASIQKDTLCVQVLDSELNNEIITSFCPADFFNPNGQVGVTKGINLARGKMNSAYGLGQQFKISGSADGDWVSFGEKLATPNGSAATHTYGNSFMGFGGGAVGNIQIPVLYASSGNGLQYALFYDNVYKQSFKFTENSTPQADISSQTQPIKCRMFVSKLEDCWQVRSFGDQIRFYVIAGNSLLDLRQKYMNLVGRAPVPPKKAFGLWVSQFGYKNWDQVTALKNELRKEGFPVEGFVFDLFWYGGRPQDNIGRGRVGDLDWDQDPNDGNDFYFPLVRDGKDVISEFAKDGIGFINIEQSYISLDSLNFGKLEQERDNQKGVSLLAYGAQSNDNFQTTFCEKQIQNPAIIREDANKNRPVWIGDSAYLDWTNPYARLFFHTKFRLPNIIQKGVIGHWTDLGEPEMHVPSACYFGVEGEKNRHADINNIYNLLWSKGIYDGYVLHNKSGFEGAKRRPFSLSRSGSAGSQRYGVGMWSGDIGSNVESLATHMNAAMHMSFAGIDYYGADVGGFRKESLPYRFGRDGQHFGSMAFDGELYTQWFANAAWFDFPLRPHVDNGFVKNANYQTSPAKVGSLESNRKNLQQRYEHIPYYYSLAHKAYQLGTPIVSPVVMYFPSDSKVQRLGNQKMVGSKIMVAMAAQHGEWKRPVYFPKDEFAQDWVDFENGSWFKAGTTVEFPVFQNSQFRLPSFYHAGAIIPQMISDEKTKNVFGERTDNKFRNEIIVSIVPSERKSEFEWVDDDGTNVSFEKKSESLEAEPKYEVVSQKIEQQATVKDSFLDNGSVRVSAATGSFGRGNSLLENRNYIYKIYLNSVAMSEVTLNLRNTKKSIKIISPLVGESCLKTILSETITPYGESFACFDGKSWNVRTEKLNIREAHVLEYIVEKRIESEFVTVTFSCGNVWTKTGSNSLSVVGNIAQLGSWKAENSSVKVFPSLVWEYFYNHPGGFPGAGPNVTAAPVWTVTKTFSVKNLISELKQAGSNEIRWKCFNAENNQWSEGSDAIISVTNSSLESILGQSSRASEHSLISKQWLGISQVSF